MTLSMLNILPRETRPPSGRLGSRRVLRMAERYRPKVVPSVLSILISDYESDTKSELIQTEIAQAAFSLVDAEVHQTPSDEAPSGATPALKTAMTCLASEGGRK